MITAWWVSLCCICRLVYFLFCVLHYTTTYGDNRPDDGGSKYLWNVGKLLPDYTAQKTRKQPSSYSPPWEPKFSLSSTCLRSTKIDSLFGLQLAQKAYCFSDVLDCDIAGDHTEQWVHATDTIRIAASKSGIKRSVWDLNSKHKSWLRNISYVLALCMQNEGKMYRSCSVVSTHVYQAIQDFD
jgi:hypothetical protein